MGVGLAEVGNEFLLLMRFFGEQLHRERRTFLMVAREGVMRARKSLQPTHFSKLRRKAMLVAGRLSWLRFPSISRISRRRVR